MLNAKEETQDLKFAVFNGGGEITEEMYKEVREFAEYVKTMEKKKPPQHIVLKRINRS